MTTIKNLKGKALYSWRVEILSELGYGDLYDQLKINESWDSPHNIELLDQHNTTNDDCSVPMYSCPSAHNNNISNYVSIIGPGTAWREDKPVQLSDLPDGGAHTVMILEMINSEKHWGKPEFITVENLLEQLNTPQGYEKLSYHPCGIHILLADGSVWRVPRELPFAIWQKLLTGEIKSLDDLNNGLDKSVSDLAWMPYNASEKPSIFEFENSKNFDVYALLVWLFSLVLLFRRALKNRIKPAIEQTHPLGNEPTA